LLWLAWSISYAGDALQLLAQTWLIAVLTGSALAVAGSPALAAVVHAQGRTLVDRGVLAAATSFGTFLGAAYAGMRRAAAHEPLRYAQLGIVGAAALAAFAVVPVGPASLAPLPVVGAIFGAETVWNAGRVAELGDAVFQGRLQAITTMALGSGRPSVRSGRVRCATPSACAVCSAPPSRSRWDRARARS
jgi:hypothetical protein